MAVGHFLQRVYVLKAFILYYMIISKYDLIIYQTEMTTDENGMANYFPTGHKPLRFTLTKTQLIQYITFHHIAIRETAFHLWFGWSEQMHLKRKKRQTATSVICFCQTTLLSTRPRLSFFAYFSKCKCKSKQK